MKMAEKGGCGGLVSVGVVEDVIIEFIRFFSFFFWGRGRRSDDDGDMLFCDGTMILSLCSIM